MTKYNRASLSSLVLPVKAVSHMHSLITHVLPDPSAIEQQIPADWVPTFYVPRQKIYRRQRVELPG